MSEKEAAELFGEFNTDKDGKILSFSIVRKAFLKEICGQPTAVAKLTVI